MTLGMLKDIRRSDVLWSAFGFALMTAYWPGISGAATTPRWIVGALLAVVLFFAPRVRMTAAHWLGLALIGWLFLSLAWNDGGTDGRLDGVANGFDLLICLIAFAVGSSFVLVIPVLAGAALGIGVNSAVAVMQWYGLHGPVETIFGGDAGLFVNADRLAAAAAMVAVGLVALPRLWMLLPLLLPSLYLAPSRAALLAIVAGVLMTPWPVKAWGGKSPIYRVLPLSTFGILVMIAAALLRWATSGETSTGERLAIWEATITHLSFFGHGLGSFREVFLQTAQAYDFNHWGTRPEHPHNEFLWLAFEGGVPAVGLGIAFALSVWRRAADAPERGVLAALFVLSVFAMPFHDPATLVLGALCAGYFARARDVVGHVFVDRGMALRPGLPADVDRAKHRAFRDRETSLSVPAAVS